MLRATLFIAGLALSFAGFGQTEAGSKQLGHVKLVEDFVHAPENKPAPFVLNQGFGTNLRAPVSAEARRIRIARALQTGLRCGHIIVKSAPPGIDSKSMHAVPKGAEAMPVLKGLPVCPEDIR
jgi:hypothetical protein